MSKPVLLIDPGHGGVDPGGGGNNRWKEKEFNLEISRYQFQRFKDLGISVAMTRDSDITLGPTERARLVREIGSKYCISNHINAGGGEGAETIHSIYSKPTMARLIIEELVKMGQKARNVPVFVRTLPQDPTKDFYYMHRNTGATEVTVVEYGFADNPRDVERLMDNWKEYAEAVVKAMCVFLNVPYSKPSIEGSEQIKVRIHGRDKMIEGFKQDKANYVPIRFLESLGYEIGWEEGSKTVTIEYAKGDK